MESTTKPPKVIKDGKVAVLVSAGYGAGWSTWNRDIPECLYDPEIVQLIIDGKPSDQIVVLAEAKWPNGYWGGVGIRRV